ncbi:hypothetical protein GNF10_27410 [Nostoc sp. UCD121]|uniref:COP23 domain-containing protein n=1 Tax=unclassified Nostoc TaxID=2593658 RepID=UPI0016267CE7|nr:MULTISPECIES: COP23 domain-containing protein [unclassified Nostoc]MBC1224177.1 hypothetical protein [Nostoc sp. UCD120]MBC1279584.1 hypothetical protein [Nostoc sp. UCD121]
MNFKLFASLLTAAVLSLVATLTISSYGQAQTQKNSFSCSLTTQKGFPATMVKTGSATSPFIYWKTNFFGNDWTSEKRCMKVTERLNTYNKQGKLGYFTTGKMRGYNVVCVTSKNDGPCEGLLYTIKQGVAPTEAIDELLSAFDQAGTTVENSGAIVHISKINGKKYINLREMLTKLGR